MNALLRRPPDEDSQQKLRHFLPYMKLLWMALGKLPTVSCQVYRALGGLPQFVWDQYCAYNEGGSFTWSNFNSTSTSEDASRGFLRGTYQIFFKIRCTEGYNIKDFSEQPQEDEVLLPPGTVFRVDSAEVTKSGTVNLLEMAVTQCLIPQIVQECLMGSDAQQQC
jgi:hypothetical protein